MSLNKIVNPMLNQQLNIIVNSLESIGPLVTTCTDDEKKLYLTPPLVGNIGDILTRVGSTGNVAFLPPPGSGGTVVNPLNTDLNIGLYDVIGLPLGKTLKGINELQVEQGPLVTSSANKTVNIDETLTTPFGYTVFNGAVRATIGMASQQFGSPLFQSKITMTDNSPNSTVNVVTNTFQYNGNPVATVADIQTITLSAVGTGDSIVFQDVGPSLSVKSFLSGDGIQLFSSGDTIEISSTDQPRITSLENKTQNISLAGSTFTTFSGINGIYAQNFAKQGVGSTSDDIMLGNGSYSSLYALTNGIFNLQNKTQNQTADTVVTNFSGVGGIVSNKFVKNSGLSNQFLMANGDVNSTPYIPSTGLNTNLLLADGSTTSLSRITNLETKTTFQSIVSGNTSFSSGLVLNGPITTNGASNIDIMSMDRPYIGIQYIHNSAVIATQSNSLWTAAGSTSAVTAPYSTANNVTRQLCSANWSFPTNADGAICGYGATITSGAQVCTAYQFGLIFVGNIADTGYNVNNCQNVFGLWSSSTPPSLSQSVQLSARANHIVFGSDTNDPNICIYTAGAAAGSNKQVDLGSSFPANRPSANASTDWLKLCLWWDGSTTMYYKAVNETLNVTVTGSFVPTAGQIPIPTFTLYPQCCRVMGSPNSSGQARLIVKRFGVF